MAQFDDMPYGTAIELARQQFEKRGKGAFVDRHSRGELPQYRPELVAQFEQAAGKEPVERRTHARQIAAMSDKARPLQREDKILRRLIVPAAVAGRLLQAVE